MTIAPESPAYRRPNPGTWPLTMMNPRPICVLLLSFFVPFLGAGLVHAPSMAATQQPETFKSQFELARKVGNKAGMQQLVKRDMDGAVAFILEVAEGIANNPSELVFERMEALKETWKAEVRTDFCEKMETFFSRIPVPLKRDRRRLRLSYDKLAGDWQTNSKGARDRKEFNRIAAEFKQKGNITIVNYDNPNKHVLDNFFRIDISGSYKFKFSNTVKSKISIGFTNITDK